MSSRLSLISPRSALPRLHHSHHRFISHVDVPQTQREQHCPECVGGVLGDHPRDWTERHADPTRWLTSERLRSLHRPSVTCSYNSPAGISIPFHSWRAISGSDANFCDRTVPAYDDAIHAMQNEREGKHRAIEPGAQAAVTLSLPSPNLVIQSSPGLLASTNLIPFASHPHPILSHGLLVSS